MDDIDINLQHWATHTQRSVYIVLLDITASQATKASGQYKYRNKDAQLVALQDLINRFELRRRKRGENDVLTITDHELFSAVHSAWQCNQPSGNQRKSTAPWAHGLKAHWKAAYITKIRAIYERFASEQGWALYTSEPTHERNHDLEAPIEVAEVPTEAMSFDPGALPERTMSAPTPSPLSSLSEPSDGRTPEPQVFSLNISKKRSSFVTLKTHDRQSVRHLEFLSDAEQDTVVPAKRVKLAAAQSISPPQQQLAPQDPTNLEDEGATQALPIASAQPQHMIGTPPTNGAEDFKRATPTPDLDPSSMSHEVTAFAPQLRSSMERASYCAQGAVRQIFNSFEVHSSVDFRFVSTASPELCRLYE
jgi:hypothetical protein